MTGGRSDELNDSRTGGGFGGSVFKQGACHAVRALLAPDHGVLLVATIFSRFKPVRQRPAHRFAAALLMGGGWEVERLQDNALAIVDEAASGELICLRLAD